jgi:uncharacterized protein YegL
MKNKTQKIYNLIILDESGSMGSIKRQTILGFNDLSTKIKGTQKMFPNQYHYISFVTFNDSGIKFRLFNQPVGELNKIDDRTFHPDGLTPLYDAICKGVLKLKHELYHDTDYNILVTIITDGEENSSSEFSQKETKLLIENLSENPNWAFGLIGANIDVEAVANSLSIPIKRTISFNSEDSSVKQMFDRYGKAQEKLTYIIDEGGECNDLPF